MSPREQRGCPLAHVLPPGICAFKFHFCTMFTSFRFNTRRAALCEGNRPKRSFHEATSRRSPPGLPPSPPRGSPSPPLTRPLQNPHPLLTSPHSQPTAYLHMHMHMHMHMHPNPRHLPLLLPAGGHAAARDGDPRLAGGHRQRAVRARPLRRRRHQERSARLCTVASTLPEDGAFSPPGASRGAARSRAPQSAASAAWSRAVAAAAARLRLRPR